MAIVYPRVHGECVDTKTDLKKYGDITHYMNEKTDDLLGSGVERVIWILTEEL